MDATMPLRLLPTLPMLAECMEQNGWNNILHISDRSQYYRSIRPYHGQQDLKSDVLYLLQPEETRFPVDDYTYLSSRDHGGKANHLVCPGRQDVVILDQVMEIFLSFSPGKMQLICWCIGVHPYRNCVSWESGCFKNRYVSTMTGL